MGELEGAKCLYLKCALFFQKYCTIKNMKVLLILKIINSKNKKIHQTINNN